MKLEDIYNSTSLEEILHKSQDMGREILDDYFSQIPYSDKEKKKELSFFYEDLEFIRKKWILEILWELETYKGSNFNELKRSIKGISSRSLSDRLKNLEENQIVDRIVEESRPPSVLYKLTKKGEGFVELMVLVILFLKDSSRD